MKKKRRDVNKDNKIKAILLITLVLITSLIYFLGYNDDLDTVDSVVGEAIRKSTYRNSFISKCVAEFGRDCVMKLLKSPVIVNEVSNKLHAQAYKQIIGDENKAIIGKSYFSNRRSSRNYVRSKSVRMKKIVRKRKSINYLGQFLRSVNTKYSRLEQSDQYKLIDGIARGDKILRRTERIIGREISPSVFINDVMAGKSHLILVKDREEDREGDRDDPSGPPGSGVGQGGGGISVGSSSGGGSGSTFLDCIKKQSEPGSVTPGPEVGGGTGGLIGTTFSGSSSSGDPMLDSTGIGKDGGKLICGPGGNIEDPKGGGLTQGDDDEGTETETTSDTTVVSTAKADKAEAKAEAKAAKDKAATDNIEGMTKYFSVKVSDSMSVGAMKYSAKQTPAEQTYYANKGVANPNPTYYGVYVGWNFYNPESAETSSAIEAGGQFEVDCGDGNVLLCMFSNNNGGGDGDCYETELDPYGHPDPNTIKPCGGDVPADAIDFPDNYLVDPVPYLQQVQQQMGTFHTPMLYQTVYLKTNYDKDSGFDNN